MVKNFYVRDRTPRWKTGSPRTTYSSAINAFSLAIASLLMQ